MLSEYAVEPAAIAEDWKTCRYLAELFGFDRGRVLSQYPKKWLPMAIEAANHLPPMEKKRVIEKLKNLKDRSSVRGGRTFDPSSGTWLENALIQHAAAPFRAIVAADSVPGQAEVVTPDNVSDIDPLFAVQRSVRIPREAAAITQVLAPLISFSRRALLVDKYYDPFNTKYQITLQKLLSLAQSINPDITFEVHYCEHGRCPDAAAIERESDVKYLGIIPPGMSIKVVRWREKLNGMNFHARYFLTDRGGIGIDAGFSSEGFQQATDVQLLEVQLTLDTMRNLESSANIYDQVGRALMIDENGRVSYV